MIQSIAFLALPILAGIVNAAPQLGHWEGRNNGDYWSKEAIYHWQNNGKDCQGYNAAKAPFKYVAVISIDGMHASDVEKYLAARPTSNISMLLNTAYEYTDAYTSAPSDSFPGTVAQYTGGVPAETSIWYDDTWAFNVFNNSNPTCSGISGAEVDDTEDLDYNSTELFSGGINPANLPFELVNGRCERQYPHNRLRVNTVFEVVRSKGKETAYSDKHPAYDVVRGPSGSGLNTGFFPEIAAVPGDVASIIAYDQYRVTAFTEWMDGRVPAHSEGNLTAPPALYGGNFQAVNAAQKKYGYTNATGNPFTPQLLQAFDATDAHIGQIVNKMKANNVYNDTLIIVASKHGQGSIDPSLYAKIDPQLLADTITVPTAWITTDNIALIYLNSTADVPTAAAELSAASSALQIQTIYAGAAITAAGLGVWTPERRDPATPDIIVQPRNGIIYTTGGSIEQHGGLADDDRHVACFASNPRLARQQIAGRVDTTQVAPLILAALGYDAEELQAVRQGGVRPLPGF